MRDDTCTAQVKAASSVRLICLSALLSVAGFSVILTFVLPRPFYILGNDYDNGYYYNIRALREGLPIHNVEHPGTPVILLGRLLMTSTTARLDHVQPFLNELYVVVGLVSCASIGLFCLLTLRGFSAGTAALTLSSLATWPPFLTHLNQYSTESFVLVVGLVAVAAFWRILESFPRPPMGLVAFAGVACGVCLAIKLSFVPFVLAMELATSLSLLRAYARPKQKRLNLFVLWSATIGAFAIAILPVFHRLDDIVFNTLQRGDVRISDACLRAISESHWALLRESPAFVALFTSLVVLALVETIRRLRQRPRADPGSIDTSPDFDDRSGLLFIALLSSSFVYAMVCAAPDLKYYYSVGHSLRNASPSAFVVPFAILYYTRLTCKRRRQNAKPSAWRDHAMLATALVVVVSSVFLHLTLRQAMIRDRLSKIAETKARLGELRQQYGTLAFWDGSPGWRMAEASFHFWGNYRYAESYFEDELLAEFPGTSWLNLRGIRKLHQQTQQPQAHVSLPTGSTNPDARSTSRPLWKRPLHWAYQRWLAMKQRRPVFPKRPPELFAGEKRGVLVGLLAFPEIQAEAEVYQPLGWKRSDLHSWLENRLGPLRLWTETIGGLEWVFLTPRGENNGNPLAEPVRPPQ